MSDKKVLTILVFLAMYVFISVPLKSKLETNVSILRNIERSIAKEKFIEQKSKDIKKLYPKAIQKIKKDTSMFFTEDVSTSSAMSSVQKMIELIAKRNSLRVMNINWGAAIKINGYIKLPISFTLKGYSKNIFLFTRDVLSLKKILKFSIYSTTKYKNEILVRAVVVGFKIQPNETKGLIK